MITVEEILSAKEEPKKCAGELGRNQGSSVRCWFNLNGVPNRCTVDVKLRDSVTRGCGGKVGEDKAQEANFLPCDDRFH